MDEEFNALQCNHTWTLVPPSPSHHLVGTKWIYKIKRDVDGHVQRYKAHLVAKGYLQQPGLDHGETFGPVIKPSSIRVVPTLDVTWKWPLKKLDVSNAFLHGTLSEYVFITQPHGYIGPLRPHHVCKLHKALYDLKQAPQAWYDALWTTFIKWNFQPFQVDTSLLIHQLDQGTLFLLILCR